MKKLLLICFLFQIHVYGQVPNPKWIIIEELQNETILIDTSNIKLFDNQISLLSLNIYKEPVLNELIKKEVKNIKSQILINLNNRSYSVIGSLYYDENLRIIGEKNSSGTSLNSELFALPIDSNAVMVKILTKCLEILKINSIVQKDQKNNDNLLVSKRLPPVINNKEIINVSERKNEDNNLLFPVEPTKKRIEEQKPITKVTAQTNLEYDISKESNPKGTIFTDGNKYCFQVSSWKNKSKAESEVIRLKRNGHNAFIAEVNLPGRGLWYRVRIGYFNSIVETENYLSNFTK